MDELLQAVLLGLIEGITEFLPISSTGHLIVGKRLLDASSLPDELFIISIQVGAVMAILVHHAREFIELFRSDVDKLHFWRSLGISVTPALLAGIAIGGAIEQISLREENIVLIVAIALIIGGLVMLAVESSLAPPEQEENQGLPIPPPKSALFIGSCQVLAFIPGVSRSAANIIGGLLTGLSRRDATVFSFFLAVPTIISAAIYSTWKNIDQFTPAELDTFVVGFFISTLVSWICIRWLLRFISTHRFTPFAWYRLGAGTLILILHWVGIL